MIKLFYIITKFCARKYSNLEIILQVRGKMQIRTQYSVHIQILIKRECGLRNNTWPKVDLNAQRQKRVTNISTGI